MLAIEIGEGAATERMSHGTMTAEAAAQFGDGINMVLHRWAALRMAVENEWGGRGSLQKAQELGQNLFNFLSQSKGILRNSIIVHSSPVTRLHV